MRRGGRQLTDRGRTSKREDPEEKAVPDVRVSEHRSSQGSKKEVASESGNAGAGGGSVEGSGEARVSVGEESALVAELKARADEYLDHLQRLKAEFENYRKRTAREREGTWARARGDLILSIIPFIDDMRRLLESPALQGDNAKLLDGVKLIEKGIMDFLKREGLEETDARGKRFDPSVHEAIEVRRTDDPEKDGLVAEVLVPGFHYLEILLRPARVSVFKFGETASGVESEVDNENRPEGE
jgi:molecular chaperone GrpE